MTRYRLNVDATFDATDLENAAFQLAKHFKHLMDNSKEEMWIDFDDGSFLNLCPVELDGKQESFSQGKPSQPPGFIHKLETGESDKQPTADEELVAYLGMSAEVLTAVYNHSSNVKIKMACDRALNMATRLGEEHRSMYIPYSEMVKNLFKKMSTPADELMHAGAGCSGEAGELLDWCKKHWVYNKPLDSIVKKENNQTLIQCIMEELGDLTFYMQATMNLFGWTWADIRMANRVKLAKRYPDGVYSDKHAQARLDKQDEAN